MINFMKYKWLYFVVSALVIVPGLISLSTFGLKLGVDFTGGVRWELQFEKDVDAGQLYRRADAQAAIYPWQSPGGWHLLGRTPVCLFDVADVARPALLAPGDLLRFTSIDRREYDRLAAAVAARKIESAYWRMP